MGIIDRLFGKRDNFDFKDIQSTAISLFQNGQFYKTQYGSAHPVGTSLAEIIGQPLSIARQLDSYSKSAIDYACVFAKANTIASLPVKIFKLDSNGNEVETRNQSVIDLALMPNPVTTWYEFIEQQVILMELSGFVVTEIVNPRRPKELYTLRSDLVEVVTDRQGVSGFNYSANGLRQFLTARNQDGKNGYAYQVKYFNPVDMNRGHSPYLPIRYQNSIDHESLKFMEAFFKNGCHIGGIFEAGGRLSDKQIESLESQIKEKYGAASKAFKWLIAQTKDAKFHKTQTDPKEADTSNLRNMTRGDIITARGCYPIVLGFLDGASYANANIQWSLYYKNGIKPVTKRLEDAYNNQVFSKYGERFKFDFSDIPELKENEKEKSETATNYSRSGVVTINEIRNRLNLGDPIEGGDVIPQKSANPFEGMEFGKSDKEVEKAVRDIKKKAYLYAR